MTTIETVTINATEETNEERLERALRLDEESLEWFEAGFLAVAERCCREALALFEELDGPVHPDGANLLQRLSAILDAQCRYREAEECAARSVAIMDELAPMVEDPAAELIHIESLRLWGAALRQLGRYRDAKPVLRRAVELAANHADPALLVGVLNELGVLCKYSGQFPEGERVYRRALAMAVGLYGDKHPTVATICHNLGGLEHARGNFRGGEKMARRACEIRRELLGPDHPETVADECAWAGLLDGLGRYTESRRIYERALAIFERHYGLEHFEIAATLHNLSGVDAAEGHFESALHRASRALAIKEKLLGKGHPEYVQTAGQLVSILRQRAEAMCHAEAVAVCGR
jgi:tetratricopeptide (TPR) repeat protein